MPKQLRLAMAILGALATSCAVILIKIGDLDPIRLAAYRQLIAALILSPAAFRALKRHNLRFNFTLIRPSILPGLILGIHFITWIIGARMTPAANSSLIVNMVPIAVPFFIFLMMRETVTRTEALGTVVAIAGVFILAGNDFSFDRRYFNGDLLCFVSMLFFAFYLSLARKNNVQPSIWLYLVPLYFFGGLFCLAAALITGSPAVEWTTPNILSTLGLGIIPTVIGHSLLNLSMRTLRPQTVSLITLTQFVFAGIMAWFFFGEIPRIAFYLAALCVLVGAVIVITRGAENGTPGRKNMTR